MTALTMAQRLAQQAALAAEYRQRLEELRTENAQLHLEVGRLQRRVVELERGAVQTETRRRLYGEAK